MRQPSHPGVYAGDWRWLVHDSRPNGLIIGPPAVTDAMLAALESCLRRPVLHWPGDGAPWNGYRHPSTLVLHEVTILDIQAQASLLTWMNDAGRHVQVVSVASTRVYPSVQEGRFLEALYYRLNCVYIDCSDIPGSSIAARQTA